MARLKNSITLAATKPTLYIMKLIMSIALLVFSLNAFAQRSLQDNINIHRAKFLDKKFPEFSVKTINAGSFSNSDLTGKVVFINFWFQNCVPCMQKTEGLNQLYASLQNDTNFIFVSFTFEDYQSINKFRKQQNIEYNIYQLSNKQCDTICCGYPTSFILDKNGIIRAIYTGGAPTKEEATSEIMTVIYPTILKLL